MAQEEAECSCPKKELTEKKKLWRTEGKESMFSFLWHKEQEI